MGCFQSRVGAFETDERTGEVDKMLREAQEADLNDYKILLLGAGESGKSTVVKQIKLIYKGGIPEKEKEEYRINIRRNAIECMQALIEARATFGIKLGNEGTSQAEERLVNLGPDDTLNWERANDITELWNDSGIQEVFSKRDEFWLLDGAKYYFNEIDRLADDDYSPNEEDMLMTRVRTTGIVVTDLIEPPISYHIVDVGGQRSERRKWIHCFDDVKGIIFLEGLSGYNQVMFEDSTQNRMLESLELFNEVTRNPIFKETPFIVFLNKKDLFEEMIPKVDLSVCFPEYKGGPDVRASLEFIENEYRKIMESNCPGKQVIIHVIAARVRMDMKIAFADVKDQIKRFYAEKNKKKKKKK